MRFLLFLSLIITASQSSAVEIPFKDHKGKVLYVDFWASWCEPCKKAFPFLNEIHKEYKPQGLVVIGVNLDEKKKLAEEFLQAHPAQFDLLYDPEGELAKKYKLTSMPTTIIFDRSGRQVSRHMGFSSKDKKNYIDKIKKILSKKK